MSEKSRSKVKPPFLSTDSAAAFEHFSALVAGTPEDQIETLNADPMVVLHNCQRGLDAIRPHLAHVAEALPLVDQNDFLELPSIALALQFAASRVFTPASPQEIAERQARLRPMRRMGLAYLGVAAELGLVPSGPVDNIKKNRGPLDEADDGVQIAAMFSQHAAALAGKHPFSAESLKQLGEDGNWLLTQIKPRTAVRDKGAPDPQAVARDRLWTDLQRRYDVLYHAGVAVWGRRKVDEHIPSLHAQAPQTAKAAATPDKPAAQPGQAPA
jgi:hypothetical protein